jgi:hypothetical protein
LITETDQRCVDYRNSRSEVKTVESRDYEDLTSWMIANKHMPGKRGTEAGNLHNAAADSRAGTYLSVIPPETFYRPLFLRRA